MQTWGMTLNNKQNGDWREVSVECFFPFFDRTAALEHGVRRWEKKRFKSEVGSTLQINIHSFFLWIWIHQTSMSLYRVAQVEVVDRFSPKSTSVCRDFIRFKRRLGYKHHYQFKNVRPKKVLDTAKYLVDTSELFRNEGIKVQNTWVDGITSQSSTYEEWSEFVQNTNKSSADVYLKKLSKQYLHCWCWQSRQRKRHWRLMFPVKTLYLLEEDFISVKTNGCLLTWCTFQLKHLTNGTLFSSKEAKDST